MKTSVNRFFQRTYCFFAVVLMFFSVTVANGQEEAKQRKIFFGGNFGLMFGTVTDIEVSPLAGYRVTPRLSAGVGLTYEYYREKYVNNSTYATSIYGGRLFASYMVIKDLKEAIGLPTNGGIMGHVEYEALNIDANYYYYDETGRVWLSNVYVGGGFKQPIGVNSAFYILVLWNLNQSTKYSPFDNPVIRVGFYF